MSSPYHAKYFAHLLTRQGGEGVDRLARSLFAACVEDEIAEKRDTLIDALEKRLQQRTTCEQLFTLRWRVI